MIATHKRRARHCEAIQYAGNNESQVIDMLGDGKTNVVTVNGNLIVRDNKPAAGVKSIYTILPSDYIAIGEDGVRRHYSQEDFLTKYEVI